MEEILLKNCKLILDAVCLRKNKDILIREGKIEEIAEGLSTSGISIDCKNLLVIPCFFNGHTHSPMSLFRGIAEDLPLHKWLEEKVWPLEKRLNAEHMYIGAKFSAMEMLKSGFSGCADMYFNMDYVAKAFIELNFRGVLCEGIFDFFDKSETYKKAKIALDMHKRLISLNSKLIKSSFGPHATYTCSRELLEIIAEYSQEYNSLVQIHVAETMEEQNQCIERYGMREVELLDKVGLCNERCVYAHGNWFSEKEYELMKKGKVAIVQNTISNLKLASGSTADLRRLINEGIRCCLGTDGPASNNSLDPFEMMKFSSLLQKYMHKDPSVLSSRDIFRLATYEAYKIFYPELKIGLIEKSYVADLALYDLNEIRMKPLISDDGQHIINHLVYSCSGMKAKYVIVNGEISVFDYRLAKENEDEIIKKFEKAFEDLIINF
jgi:5-methylthioadenosine/S-adenosylhomocysteine deaminase